MRIQDTNKIINESKLTSHAVDTRTEPEQSTLSRVIDQVNGWIPAALRDRRVLAGIAAIATVSAGATMMNSRRGARWWR